MITSLYAALLACLFFRFTMMIIRKRKKLQISLGLGENNELLGVVSAYNNFTQYVPIFLILFFLADLSNIYHWLILHLLGLAFCLGRGLHFYAIKDKMNFKNRVLGMKLTIWPILILMALNIFSYLNNIIGFIE